MSGKRLYLINKYNRIEIRNYLCLVLSCLSAVLFFLSGCGINKEYMVTDLKLEDRIINVMPRSAGTKIDLDNGELTLLHEFEDEKVSIYYYEAFRQTLWKEVHIEEIVLKKGDNFYSFILPIDADYFGSDENRYEVYDYDNDGSAEFAVLFSLLCDRDYPDKKLFIFDYNEDKEMFYVTYLGMPNIRDMVEECFIKYYEEKYNIKYGSINYGGSGENESLILYCTSLAVGGCLIYGDHIDASFLKNGGINLEIMLSGPVDGENAGLEEKGIVVCDVQYLDIGKFSVNASTYKERLKNK